MMPSSRPQQGRCPRNGSRDAAWAQGTLSGDYVELGHHETVATLRRALAPRLVHYGIADLDAATIKVTTPRALTQEMSRLIFDGSTADGVRRWNGISYLSRFGDDLENWAIFEPATPSTSDISAVDDRDEDLTAALRVHGLHMSTNGSERHRRHDRPARRGFG